MAKVRVLSDDALGAWDGFVASHGLGTAYHTSAWRKVIEEAYGYKPVYLAIENENGAIVGGLPLFQIGGWGKRLSGLPCAQYSNPLVSDQGQYDELMKFVLDFVLKNKLRYSELKTSEDFPFAYDRQKWLYEGYTTYLLPLDRPIADIFDGLHKSCIQRSIKKADRVGIKLVTGNSVDDVKKFYALHFKMRKQKGLLPQPYRFFEAIWKTLRPKNMVDILHAEQEGEVISSLIIVKYKDTVTYEYGASRVDKMNLSPSNFLLWEAIKKSKEEGYKIFDFGRTNDDGQQSLALYKSRWGTIPLNLYYHYIPHRSGVSKLRHSSVMKELMHVAIKAAPDFLCNMMGKMLYQHLA